MSDSSKPAAGAGRKVFIRTFGCQMNEYDSDKMADVLRAAQGYEPTDDPEQADLILFNTCSVREKAQEKVFSDLGRVKHLKDKGVLIGVGGCVASQEGAAIIERAPYVDLVFGPQTLHRLPQMIEQRHELPCAAPGTQAHWLSLHFGAAGSDFPRRVVEVKTPATMMPKPTTPRIGNWLMIPASRTPIPATIRRTPTVTIVASMRRRGEMSSTSLELARRCRSISSRTRRSSSERAIEPPPIGYLQCTSLADSVEP